MGPCIGCCAFLLDDDEQVRLPARFAYMVRVFDRWGGSSARLRRRHRERVVRASRHREPIQGRTQQECDQPSRRSSSHPTHSTNRWTTPSGAGLPALRNTATVRARDSCPAEDPLAGITLAGNRTGSGVRSTLTGQASMAGCPLDPVAVQDKPLPAGLGAKTSAPMTVGPADARPALSKNPRYM